MIAAMARRTIAGNADAVELSRLLWGATGCGEAASQSEEVTLVAEHPLPLQRAGDGGTAAGPVGGRASAGGGGRGPRLQRREIGEVHEALVGAWKLADARWCPV